MLMKNKLISDLKKNIPASNVLDTLEERYAYAQDATNIKAIKNLPDAVVFVENIDQVQTVVKLANKYKIPIICHYKNQIKSILILTHLLNHQYYSIVSPISSKGTNLSSTIQYISSLWYVINDGISFCK